MNKINKLFLGILVLSLMISTASAATSLENHIAGVGQMAHPTSNAGIAGCSSCHTPIGSTTTAGFCTNCHSFPVFSLAVAANPTTVTANTSTSVSFAVNQTNTVNVTNKTAANGALVTLSGPGVSTSGTTSNSGIVAIPVTPTGAGTINAIAELTGFNNGTASVTVTAPTPAPVLKTITVAPPNITLSVGVTQTFTATARDENGAPMGGNNVGWTSSNTSVGNVSPAAAMTNANGTATTTFTATANGTAMVNATNGSVSGSAGITVSEVIVVPPVLKTITVSPSTATLSVGDTQLFTATALDQNGNPMGGINVEWTSSNTSVGNVSPVAAMTNANGTVTTTFTATANGTATVNATNGSVSGSAGVTVSEVVITPVLKTITILPSTATLLIGDTQLFTATARDENGAPMKGINITWTSSNMSVGNVSPDAAMTDANGTATTTFTAIANGTSMVNATNGSVSGSTDVIVGEEIEEINLIKNGCFESGKVDWLFFTNGKGIFSIISPGFEGDDAAHVTLTSGGSNIQLYQTGVTLKPNTNYRLSFAAKSSSARDVKVVLFKHGSPYTNYGLDKRFDLKTNWQTFSTEFSTTGFTDTVDDGRLMFYLAPYAKTRDNYYFDSVKLVEIE